MRSFIDAKVQIKLHGSSQGGRKTPIASGYRPSFHFGEIQADGAIAIEPPKMVFPGEVFSARAIFIYSESLKKTLGEGVLFVICEANRVIGGGHIVSVRECPTGNETKLSDGQ